MGKGNTIKEAKKKKALIKGASEKQCGLMGKDFLEKAADKKIELNTWIQHELMNKRPWIPTEVVKEWPDPEDTEFRWIVVANQRRLAKEEDWSFFMTTARKKVKPIENFHAKLALFREGKYRGEFVMKILSEQSKGEFREDIPWDPQKKEATNAEKEDKPKGGDPLLEK